jgi:hypothetical protein
MSKCNESIVEQEEGPLLFSLRLPAVGRRKEEEAYACFSKK